jgi:heptosyltransferase-3
MVRNLLFITSNRLGDAVLSTGLLTVALGKFKPQAVTIACGPIPAPLFAGVPNLKKIILLDKKQGGGHWFQCWKEVVGTRWDVVIDLRNSIVSYLVLSKQTFRFTGTREARHKSVQLAEVLGLSAAPFNHIWTNDAARQRAAELVPSGDPVLALCPTANWGPKQWPAPRFAEMARELPYKRIALFGAAHERAQAQPILDALSVTYDVIDLIGKTDPLEAAACLQRCALCVANDSGLMHIAAAMGIPTVGLFGPSDDREYAPHGPRAVYLRGAPFAGLDKTANPQGLMEAISVDTVLHKIKAL